MKSHRAHSLSRRSRSENPGYIGRALWTLLGSISLSIGLLGLLVPLLPTTPFLLASAFCYLKGSRRMYNWMMGNRVFGRHLRNYHEGRSMEKRAKMVSLSFLWATLLATFLILGSDLVIGLVLLTVLVAVTTHIVLLPSIPSWEQ